MRAWLRFVARHRPPSSSTASHGSGPWAASVGSEAYSPTGTTPMRPNRRTSRSSSTRPSSSAHHARTYGSSSPGRKPQHPGHPQVHHQLAVVVERQQQVLASTPDRVDARAGRERRRRELRRRVTPRLGDRAPRDAAAPAAAEPSRPRAAPASPASMPRAALLQLVREEVHEEAVVPGAVGGPFVAAHHADGLEAELGVGGDGPAVGGVGIDREAVVTPVVDEVAGEGAEGVEGDAGAVPLGGDGDVDAGRAVVGLLLLVALDDAGDDRRRPRSRTRSRRDHRRGARPPRCGRGRSCATSAPPRARRRSPRARPGRPRCRGAAPRARPAAALRPPSPPGRSSACASCGR